MIKNVYWRCFHCGDEFTEAEVNHAREHFGDSGMDKPVCLIREPGEHAVLRALRKVQRELDTYRSEDTPLLRAMWSMAADHDNKLKQQEELGYARGLRDAKIFGDTSDV